MTEQYGVDYQNKKARDTLGLARQADNTYLTLCGGITELSGAYLTLYGKNYTTNGGGVELVANNGTNTVSTVIEPANKTFNFAGTSVLGYYNATSTIAANSAVFDIVQSTGTYRKEHRNYTGVTGTIASESRTGAVTTEEIYDGTRTYITQKFTQTGDKAKGILRVFFRTGYLDGSTACLTNKNSIAWTGWIPDYGTANKYDSGSVDADECVWDLVQTAGQYRDEKRMYAGVTSTYNSGSIFGSLTVTEYWDNSTSRLYITQELVRSQVAFLTYPDIYYRRGWLNDYAAKTGASSITWGEWLPKGNLISATHGLTFTHSSDNVTASEIVSTSYRIDMGGGFHKYHVDLKLTCNAITAKVSTDMGVLTGITGSVYNAANEARIMGSAYAAATNPTSNFWGIWRTSGSKIQCYVRAQEALVSGVLIYASLDFLTLK